MNDADLVAEARRWLGTPFVHQGSCRGAGCDCLGLIRGLWRARFGEEPQPLPWYAPDWSATGGDGPLLAGLGAHLRPVARATPLAPGQVLAFRIRAHGKVTHLGVLIRAGADPRFVHAYCRHGVVDSALTTAWTRRIAVRFAFPPAGDRAAGAGDACQ